MAKRTAGASRLDAITRSVPKNGKGVTVVQSLGPVGDDEFAIATFTTVARSPEVKLTMGRLSDRKVKTARAPVATSSAMTLSVHSAGLVGSAVFAEK